MKRTFFAKTSAHHLKETQIQRPLSVIKGGVDRHSSQQYKSKTRSSSTAKTPGRFNDGLHFVSNSIGYGRGNNQDRINLLFLLLIASSSIVSAALWDTHAISLTTDSYQGLPSNPSLGQAHLMLGQHSLFYQQPIRKSTEERRPLFYRGLPTKDISATTRGCSIKDQGVSAGKICFIDNIKHFLKAVDAENNGVDRKTDALLGIYNLKIIKENMGVTVPEVSLVYEKRGSYFIDTTTSATAEFYVASKHVANFTTDETLRKKINRDLQVHKAGNPSSQLSFSSLRRAAVVRHIGEHGIAALAVAGTFFQDLVMNEANWGYDDNGLVIIDVDHSPSTMEEYLFEAARVPRNIELDFSINTVKLMKQRFERMLTKPAPSLHESVNMSPSFYKALLSLYITACNNAVLKVKTDHEDLEENIPTAIVNSVLTKSFLSSMAFARENGFFTRYQRSEIVIYEYELSKSVVLRA